MKLPASLNAQVKLAAELFLSEVEKLCAILAERKELDTTRNNKATVPRCEDSSASTADIEYNKVYLLKVFGTPEYSEHVFKNTSQNIPAVKNSQKVPSMMTS